jgi:pyrroline-5-carboxylate reductase
MMAGLKIGIIGGGGWLGSAIANAMVQNGSLAEEQLGVSYRSQRPESWPKAFVTKDSQALADWADVILLSVRPADWPALQISAHGKLAISVMAGITLAQLAAQHETQRVVRTIPNVFATVGHCYTPWVGSAALTAEDRDIVKQMFAACGVADECSSEQELDYFTGLTGSGPAFPALFAEALFKDAVARGIAPERAERAIAETLIGTGLFLKATPQHPSAIVDDFLNYRGTTAAAITAMRDRGLEKAVSEGLSAALRKSIEMGKR